MRHALQFLTVLPVGRLPDMPLGRSAWAFPLVGLLIGLVAAAFLRLPFGPLLALSATCLLTGGLHEDGLADVFDALRKHRSRERMLAILKDSRIGAHGALALIATFCLRWQALVILQNQPWWRIPVAYGISRGVLVLLAASTTPATPEAGLGSHFSQSIPAWMAWFVLVQVLLLTAVHPLWLIGVNVIIFVLLRHWFLARLRGVTGDCLGATCQISEAASLIALTL